MKSPTRSPRIRFAFLCLACLGAMSLHSAFGLSPVSPPDGGDTIQPAPTPVSGGGGGITPLSNTNATWTGGGGNHDWGTTGNWSGGTPPDGSSSQAVIIHFAGSTRTTPNNNYGGYTQFQQILFDSGASSFTLNGAVIKLYDWGGTGKVENNSSNLQTVSFSTDGGRSILFESSGELDPTAGDLTISGGVYADAGTDTISVFGGAGHVLTLNGEVGQFGSAVAKITNQSNNIIVFNAANTYTGDTTVKGGEVRFGQSGSSNSSTILLGDTTGAQNAAVTLSGSSAQTLSSAMTVQSGNSGTETLKAQNTSGTSQWNGTITLNKGLTVAATNSGGTFQLATVTAGSVQTLSVGDGSTTNAGTVSLAGSSDNVNLAAVVNSGTLLLAKASSSSVHALGGGLTVNSGGTVKLGGTGGDQIFNSMAVTLNGGGTFKTAGLTEGTAPSGPLGSGGSAGIGQLSLLGTSGSHTIIDFGSTGSTLVFSSLAAGVTSSTYVDIYNWTGQRGFDTGAATNDRLLFAADPLLSESNLQNFRFFSDAGTTLFSAGATEFAYGGEFEIVAVPEPGTWVAGALALAAIALIHRRRFARVA